MQRDNDADGTAPVSQRRGEQCEAATKGHGMQLDQAIWMEKRDRCCRMEPAIKQRRQVERKGAVNREGERKGWL